MMTITPLRQKLLRILTRSRLNFRDVASMQWTVASAERLSSPPAIYLDGDLDHVTAVMEDTTFEQEKQRITGGPTEHAATTAYRISDCELLDGSLYKGAVRLPLSKQPERLISTEPVEEISEASLAGSYYGSFYFGHWLTDDLTLQLAGQALAPVVVPDRAHYSHESGYNELLGMTARRVKRVRFKSLLVFDDFGQNAYKRERYEEIRSRLTISGGSVPGKSVFIRRGNGGALRALTNADAVESALVARGFVVVEPETCSVAEIVKALDGAHLVVGLEGSHLLHAIYAMSQQGGVCVLQPPYRFNNVLKNYTDCLGMQYGFVTGKSTEGGFLIETERLHRVLDKLEQPRIRKRSEVARREIHSPA